MKPRKVSDLELAFPTGATIQALMPDIDLDKYPTGWGEKLFTRLFFSGGKVSLKPKDGVDADMAYGHIGAIMGSGEPKHEHKAAACAYLFELWFEEPAAEGEAK